VTYCPEHTQAWAGSTWKKPKRWEATRQFVLRRDRGICYICGEPGADQIDHVRNQARQGSDNPENLRAVHADPCHKQKTQQDRWNRRTLMRHGTPLRAIVIEVCTRIMLHPNRFQFR